LKKLNPKEKAVTKLVAKIAEPMNQLGQWASDQVFGSVSFAKIKSAAFMSNSRVFQTTYLMHLS